MAEMNQTIDPLELQAQTELAMLDVHQKVEEMEALKPKAIGEKELKEALKTLEKYKSGKTMLDRKLVANEQFWKLRQWDYHRANDDAEFNPASARLWSCIQSRYSDTMDSYPTCNFLPRQSDDKEEARKLSAIVPVILEQNKFEDVYSDVAWYMLKQGGCPIGVFWDPKKNNGLGDIAIKQLDFLNMFWKPGIKNIQESENVFTVELVSKKILIQKYPQVEGHLSAETVDVAKYLYDDQIDTEDMALVIDWYYKKEIDGRVVVHYVQFVEDFVLYATENNTTIRTNTVIDSATGIPTLVPIEDEPESVRGLYDHGLYPFVIQDLYPIEGSLCGFGIIDIGRDTQMQIDVMDKAISENTVVGASPNYLYKDDGSINVEDFLNPNKRLKRVQGSVSEDHIRVIPSNALSSTYVSVLDRKVDELKQVTSNQDVNNGAAPSGITAASALAALQETAGKNSRSTNKAFYRMYREMVYIIVELIRQFYKTPRTFRIAPDLFGEEFISYTNENIKLQPQSIGGVDMGFRKPEFDIEITAEKQSPYKKMEHNELALNFYQLGFFRPDMADQALACLSMMDFDGKEEIMQMIEKNSTMMKMMLQYQQMALMLAQKYDPALAQEMASNILGQANQPVPISSSSNKLIDLEANKESSITGKAREQARESTKVQ